MSSSPPLCLLFEVGSLAELGLDLLASVASQLASGNLLSVSCIEIAGGQSHGQLSTGSLGFSFHRGSGVLLPQGVWGSELLSPHFPSECFTCRVGSSGPKWGFKLLKFCFKEPFPLKPVFVLGEFL